MNQLTDHTTGTKRKNRSRQSMHCSGAPSSRRKKLATLFLAGLVGLIGSGAVFMDRPAPSNPVSPATEYSESKKHPDPISAPQDGAEIYLTRCMACHQMNGGGVPGVFPPLTGTDWVTGSEEVLIRIILNGMTGEIEVNSMVYTGAMPPWGAFLNDEEMASLLTYIRTEWGNDGTEITPETVARVREAVAEREEPWTVEELEAMREAEE